MTVEIGAGASAAARERLRRGRAAYSGRGVRPQSGWHPIGAARAPGSSIDRWTVLEVIQ